MREPGEDEAEAPSTVKRIYPCLSGSDRDGECFEVPVDSKLDSNIRLLDVWAIFQKHHKATQYGYPRKATVKGRVMLDLGKWWQCDDCKRRVLEFEEQGLLWRQPSGQRLCHDCVLKVKIDAARRKDQQFKDKRAKDKAKGLHMPSLLPE